MLGARSTHPKNQSKWISRHAAETRLDRAVVVNDADELDLTADPGYIADTGNGDRP
jgi:hypothetical protein